MNRITNELCPSKSFRELKENYKNLPLKITYKITDELSPSENFKELEKKFIEHTTIKYNSLTITFKSVTYIITYGFIYESNAYNFFFHCKSINNYITIRLTNKI